MLTQLFTFGVDRQGTASSRALTDCSPRAIFETSS